jgi:hypothetical protein
MEAGGRPRRRRRRQRHARPEDGVREEAGDAADGVADDDAGESLPTLPSLEREEERRGAETREDERLTTEPRDGAENRE